MANAVFQQFLPTFLAKEGLKCLFFFMAINIVLATYVYFFIPETKQIPLEEIDTLFGGASHATEGADILGDALEKEPVQHKDGTEVHQTEDKRASV